VGSYNADAHAVPAITACLILFTPMVWRLIEHRRQALV